MLKTLSRRSQPVVTATRKDVSTASRSFGPVVGRRFFSAVPETDNESGPTGDLLNLRMEKAFSDDLVGKQASIRRVFGPDANAQGLLACGGEDLARHASFDPDYDRARSWIQNRAIGPAVLSPVLINGLVGALVEAIFPQSVPVEASMHQTRPLIVGQEVCASVQVVQVDHFTGDHLNGSSKEKDWGSPQEGHEIRLETEVIRTQDNEVIAQGTHSVWIPGYLSSYR
eukprot:Nitzschia sp. Nitz4//scaffold17_size182527//54020//54700//NITZ4_001842-RA/size182527-processed-gene-0.92-mRNA-1//1//CDS//3329539304//6498//frame0